MSKTTKQSDSLGNVFYTVECDGQLIGIVRKACSGYAAELPSGSYIPAGSIKKAVALLETR